LYPETAEVLAVHVNATAYVAACTPVPDSEMVAGDPVALLATVTLPLSLPAAVGLKTTLKVKVWFGARVTGVLDPVILKPVPLWLICEICTLPLPVLVIVTGSVEELPVLTFPKARLVVLYDKVSVCATPVPLSGTVAGEFGALLTIDKLPVAAPAEAGRNCTLKLLDCPAAREIGRLSELVLKPLPATLTWVTLSVPVPLLVTWMGCVLETPTVTFPKLALAGVTVSAG
jgi:hypothetical protein